MKIGLTYTGSPEKHQNYLNWLMGSRAGHPVVISTLSAENNNSQEVDDCDALVLSGGTDIHPGFYHSPASAYPGAPARFDKSRDQFELEVFRKAIDRKIPVLGICRGMQLINVALGGTLEQDLGEVQGTVHRGNPDKTHEVELEKGSLLYDLAKEGRALVNTAHHQGVGELGKGLKVTSRADDGVPEGIEWENPAGKGFLLGVQWHPERMFSFGLQNTALSASLLERFLKESRITTPSR